jgi:thiamine-phosphate pyrophosphorylase
MRVGRLPRFYPILDPLRKLHLPAQVSAVRNGGARIAQIRHKGVWSQPLLEAVREAARIIPLLIVNDRADIAAMTGAGVHVGQDDLPPADARGICGNAIVGLSTHNPAQTAAADRAPVDYIAIGPVFATASKANPDPVVGLDGVRQARLLTGKPLVAIGGITRANAISVLEAGTDSVAVIGDLYPEEVTEASLEARVEEWCRLLN